MEDISDDEVRALASNWVKNIQNSILTPDDDVRNSSVVRTSFGSNDERMHADHEICEENSEVDGFNSRLRGAVCPDSSISFSFKQSAVDGSGGGAVERAVTSFEHTSKQSNSKVRHSSELTGARGKGEILKGEASCKSTPRVDVSYIRQKRLAFFDSSLRSQGEDLLHDNNRNILTNITTSHSPSIEARTSTCSSSSRKQFDSPPTKCNSYATQESLDEMYHLQSLETPLLFPNNNSSPRSTTTRYPYRSPPVLELDHDEEDIRLELWGLKEAVHSGEVNLNAYLKKPGWRDDSLSSSASHNQLGKRNCDMEFDAKLSNHAIVGVHEKTKPIKIPESGA